MFSNIVLCCFIIFKKLVANKGCQASPRSFAERQWQDKNSESFSLSMKKKISMLSNNLASYSGNHSYSCNECNLNLSIFPAKFAYLSHRRCVRWKKRLCLPLENQPLAGNSHVSVYDALQCLLCLGSVGSLGTKGAIIANNSMKLGHFLPHFPFLS